MRSILIDLVILIITITLTLINILQSENPIYLNYLYWIALSIWGTRLAYFMIQIIRKKIILIINDEGIEHFKAGKFTWQEILLTLIKKKNEFGADGSYFYLLIVLIDSFELNQC